MSDSVSSANIVIEKKKVFEKPEECAICFEKLGDVPAFPCGHYIHLDCIKKHFKPECVICRQPLDIQVTGVSPDPNIGMDYNLGYGIIRNGMLYPIEISGNDMIQPRILRGTAVLEHVVERTLPEEDNESMPSLEAVQNEDDSEDDDNEERMDSDDYDSDDEDRPERKRSSDSENEEGDDYDEENPRGDNWNYEDV